MLHGEMVTRLSKDETGTRVDGKRLCVHSASTLKFTHLTISGKRGYDGMEAGGVLPAFRGIAVHDCWAPYVEISAYHTCALLRALATGTGGCRGALSRTKMVYGFH